MTANMHAPMMAETTWPESQVEPIAVVAEIKIY